MSIAVALGAGLAFWLPGFRKAGAFPIPLDDAYTHFGFARSAALGHPFTWIPENGYSSGGTSLTYPLVLAPGWLLGFRGPRLAIFAAIVAVLSIADLARSLRKLAPGPLAWLSPILLVAIPVLDWSLFSGMEVALFAAVLGRALVAVRRAEDALPHLRARAQLAAGFSCALLVATRPEAAPLALLLGVSVVHAARSLGTFSSLARALGPTTLFLAGQAAVNRLLTGEAAAAGAVRKLLLTDPYPTSLQTAIEVLKNVAALRSQAFEAPLGGPWPALILPVLTLVAIVDRRARRLALPLALGGVACLLLVCLNATARFQNYRYAAPVLLMLLAAAILGASSLARRGPFFAALAALALAAVVSFAAPGFPRQIDLFARASANIEGQQAEVARRLAALSPAPRRVFVNDAGAIPYLSGLGAIDGLGLGGYRDLPFARASVHGVPAVVELLERLPPAERPDVLALYPAWWPGLADVFGRPIDRVRIDDNVICGAPEKVISRADFSALAPFGEARPGAVDELDEADLVSERDHAYAFPSPAGGYVIGAVLDLESGPRFDGGRLIPAGQSESFTARAGGATIVAFRTDDQDAPSFKIEIARGEAVIQALTFAAPLPSPGRWRELQVRFSSPIEAGDRVRLYAPDRPLRSFHIWLLRE